MGMRATYGITRIDQPEKKNHGFYVRLRHKGEPYDKYFPDKASGGRVLAQIAARNWRDQILAALPDKIVKSPRRGIPQSGIVGVTHVVARVGTRKYEYWQAAWTGIRGTKTTTKFSVGRWGFERALELAIHAAQANRKQTMEVAR